MPKLVDSMLLSSHQKAQEKWLQWTSISCLFTSPHIDFTACQFSVVSLHSLCKASRASTQKPHILYFSRSFARGLKIIGLWSRSFQRDLKPGVDLKSSRSTQSHANYHKNPAHLLSTQISWRYRFINYQTVFKKVNILRTSANIPAKFSQEQT